jgi:diguanylate cyclase
MPGADIDAALQAAERLRASVEGEPFDLGAGQGSAPLPISAGVTELCKGDTHQSALIRADQALYEAKEGGRNCVRHTKTTPVRSATGV